MTIVTEKEYRIMSPPRRPKGEKPQTTIRYLRRVIATMEGQLSLSRYTIAGDQKKITAQDVELREAADRELILVEQFDTAAAAHGKLLASIHRQDVRLSYLEGYFYAKTADTHPRASVGNTQDLPNGAPAPEKEGLETAQGRPGSGHRKTVRGFYPRDPAYSDGRPLAEGEIARDATESDMARHRR